MRLLVCAGASGGGVYPALAVLQALGERARPVLWVGGEGGMEAELVRRAGLPFQAVPAAGVHGVGLRALPGNLRQIGRGYFAARRILDQFRPQALFFTGGYVAVPTALAGRKVPTLVFVPDIEPGLALRVVSRFADRVAVSAEEARPHFPDGAEVTVTGYPVRADLTRWERQTAFEAFGLSPDEPTLLVFGGSKGARSINRALVAGLLELLAEMQIVHLSGTLTWPEVKAAREALPPSLAARYRAYPYLHEEMGAAFTVADLAVSRAGASALGEFPLFGLPAVLVPYPHAWRYQKMNAEYLAGRGAAQVIADEELPERLNPTVRRLMADGEARARMREAMQALAAPDAAENIAGLLQGMVAGAQGQGRQP